MKMADSFHKLLQFFNLESELENQDTVYEEIKKGIIFKGTNLWILIFAVVVASVGLNMNSTAVIIGAMRYDAITENHHHIYGSGSDRIEDYFDSELNALLKEYFSTGKIPGFEIEEIKLQIIGKF